MDKKIHSHNLLKHGYQHLVDEGIATPGKPKPLDESGFPLHHIFDLGAARGADSFYYLLNGLEQNWITNWRR